MMVVYHARTRNPVSHDCFSHQDNKVTGRKADVMMAAHMAAEAALRLVKPGNEVGSVSLLFLYHSMPGLCFLVLFPFVTP